MLLLRSLKNFGIISAHIAFKPVTISQIFHGVLVLRISKCKMELYIGIKLHHKKNTPSLKCFFYS